MNTKDLIQNDVKTAMKEKDSFTRDTLRGILAAFKQVEVDERIELKDDRIFAILQSEIKKRNDSIEQYIKGNRQDLADKERAEIEVIYRYLPKQLSQEELKEKIEQIIKKVEAKSVKDLGKVMKIAKDELGASSDGKSISECVKNLLSKLG